MTDLDQAYAKGYAKGYAAGLIDASPLNDPPVRPSDSQLFEAWVEVNGIYASNKEDAWEVWQAGRRSLQSTAQDDPKEKS